MLVALEVGAAAREFVAPRNDMEAAVCAHWAELLKIERVSATDNFFHLGGDSLLATRAVSGIRRQLGVRVTVRVLFDHLTAEAFASTLSALREPGR